MSKRKASMALVVILVLCLFWMDACLYFQIQTMDEEGKAAADRGRQQDKTTTPTTYQHHESNHSGTQTVLPFAMSKFSFAFQGMSVKLMMTDPMDNYVLAPLSEAFADMINFKDNLSFISADIVSYAGVLSALVAAKLVTYDSLTLHRLSYVMFQVRTWLDDLDGAVARSRLGIHRHVSLTKTSGYVVDGVCDAIGFIAYIIGCYIFLKNSIRKRHQMRRSSQRYNLQSITEVKSGDDRYKNQNYALLKHDTDDGGRSQVEGKDISVDSHHSLNAGEDDYDDQAFDDGGGGGGCGGGCAYFTHEDDDDEEILHDTYSHINYEHQQPKKARLSRKLSHIFFKSKAIQKLSSSSSLGQRRDRKRHIVLYRYIREKIRNNLSNGRLVLLILCFLLQLAMCATFWNRYILVYQDLLESPSASIDDYQHKAKRKILKSNIMYIIIWFWRLTNGHSLMQMLITSVFLGKLWQFLEFIKYIGFIEIIILATVTELHIIDVKNYLSIT